MYTKNLMQIISVTLIVLCAILAFLHLAAMSVIIT
jgi:hypothetical protein